MNNRVSIPKRLFSELEAAAGKHCLEPKQLIIQLLEKEVVDMAHKELFSPGLKWIAPKESIIITRILEEDHPRISQWLKDRDDVQISVQTKNELWLLNGTLLSQQKAN